MKKLILFLSALFLYSCSEEQLIPNHCQGVIEVISPISVDKRTDLFILKDGVLDTAYIPSFSVYERKGELNTGLVLLKKERYCGSLISLYTGRVFDPVKVSFSALFKSDTLYNIEPFNYTGTFTTKKVAGEPGYSLLKFKIFSNSKTSRARFTFGKKHIHIDLKEGTHTYSVLFENETYNDVLVTGTTTDNTNFTIVILNLSLLNFAIDHKINDIQL